MKSKTPSQSMMTRLIGNLGVALTPESARRILDTKIGTEIQKRVDLLSRRNQEGTISKEELEEYDDYLRYNRYIAVLKSKARQLLKECGDSS